MSDTWVCHDILVSAVIPRRLSFRFFCRGTENSISEATDTSSEFQERESDTYLSAGTKNSSDGLPVYTITNNELQKFDLYKHFEIPSPEFNSTRASKELESPSSFGNWQMVPTSSDFKTQQKLNVTAPTRYVRNLNDQNMSTNIYNESEIGFFGLKSTTVSEELQITSSAPLDKNKTSTPNGELQTQNISDSAIPSTSKQLVDNQNTAVKTKARKRSHNCAYCDISVTNFSRHLKRQHSEEDEVQKFLSLNKNDINRKRLIDKIRKEGDFCSGKIIPVQAKKIKLAKNQSDSEDSPEKFDELPCVYCRGYYARKSLRRHVRQCPYNFKVKTKSKTQPQSEGQTLLASHLGPNDPLRISKVLNTLRADEVSLVAKRDRVICEVARKYVKTHKEKHLIMVARRYMRRLARLLIEVRNIEKNIKLTLAEVLHPAKFKSIVQATRNICNYSAENQRFASPSMALQMGTLIKRAISTTHSLEVQKNVHSPMLHVLKNLNTLIEDYWSIEISSEAGQNLNLNKFNKPTLLPLAEDISKMKTYLDDLISTSKAMLLKDSNSEVAYKKLIEGTYCSLLLFNKRRVGELQRIPLDTYVHLQDSQPSGEFEKLLSPTEKILIQRLRRIVIRGKRGRGVPVLIDRLTQEGLDLAIKCRHHFYENNPYLFGTCHTENSLSGYHIFRKHVSLALGDPKKTAALTSTKLRKHLATIAQILKMGNEDLKQLATLMGHTTKTHNEWYRLPSDIYQTSKVSKLLLMAQNSGVEKYKGRSLNELDDVEADIIETQDNSDSEDDTEIGHAQDHQVEIDVKARKTTNAVKKKKITKIKWSDAEKKATENYFKTHIRDKTAPKKHEVLHLMEENPTLFKNRTWEGIKAYVFNQYTKN